MKITHKTLKNSIFVRWCSNLSLLLVFLFLITSTKAQSPAGTHGTIHCNTAEQILEAMENAKPGDEIIIASGTYIATKKTQAPDNRGKWARFVGIGSGNSTKPITVRGASLTNRPILQGPTGDYNGYTMRIFGNYWIIKDLIITEGAKGLVLDRSYDCQLTNILVHNVGDEGIHLRDGSSNNVVNKCEIMNTGVVQAKYGEGIYVGSDKNQHTTDPSKTDYNPYCFDNTIENCKIGPDVAAEGVDVKEGTQNTIIRNCEFSAKGISGENSADAFIDLKGALAFVYNNTFNVDGSAILAAGIDILDRGTNDNTGYRNAVFDNDFYLGSGNDAIPSVRFKQGDPKETHFWDNRRHPESPEPEAYWTKDITYSCPSWNIVSCNDDNPANHAPSVSISSPSNNEAFTTGCKLTFTANASDSDGNIAKVEFYLGGTKIGEDSDEEYSFTKNNMANGTYSITAKATDNDGASTTSAAVSFKVENPASVPVTSVVMSPTSVTLARGETYDLHAAVAPSNASNKNVSWSSSATSAVRVNSSGIVTAVKAGSATITATSTDGNKTATCAVTVTSDDNNGDNNSNCNFEPMEVAFPSINTSYSNIYITDNGPDLSNVKKFSINWNLVNNGLYTFAFNTHNGTPEWYADLKSKVSQSLNSSQPSITILGSGFSGFDGNYYTIMDGDNLVLVEKSNSYSIYFSNSSTAPNCDSFKSTVKTYQSELNPTNSNLITDNSDLNSVSIYPNPVTYGYLNIKGLNEEKMDIVVNNMLGHTVLIKTVYTNQCKIDVSSLRTGSYILVVKGKKRHTSKLFNKL
ncbi:hypothetical protein BZG02_05015 [Labilibaculum filiforme]|uniref:BIG2 domain-containing protein n=1 Tax=Labilibaculum filiforme TaxID=1940526 RepID=A0A2N3I1J9_9BACT|nr:Ig-like domain-containing protein [Labilibaculum filiforme]PKQ64188.1 hypothetical protein BZG02_05015 [Labilibaculum filiforme]